MGMFSGNPKQEPLHYGEVFGLWTSLTVAKGSEVAYQVYYNHAGDEDLKNFIEDVIKNMIKPSMQDIEAVLKSNQVVQPPSPPERPEADAERIPVGARINDPEIAAAISKDFAQGLIADSSVIGQCVREDIATMFGQFHIKKAQMAARLLQINKEKGWIITPPLHTDREKDS